MNTPDKTIPMIDPVTPKRKKSKSRIYKRRIKFEITSSVYHCTHDNCIEIFDKELSKHCKWNHKILAKGLRIHTFTTCKV